MSTKGKKKKKAKPTNKALKAEVKVAGKVLTPQEAQDIVVNNTPRPGNFKGPDQLLNQLGIFGPKEVTGHKAGIVADVAKKRMVIDPISIISGPGVDVATCRDSVLANAH
jgi:hypothetical protein